METFIQAIDLLAQDPSSAADERDPADKATDDALLKEIVDEQARRWAACSVEPQPEPSQESEHPEETKN